MDVEIITQREASNVSWNRFKRKQKSPWALGGVDIGIHDLNLMMGGLVPGKVTTLAARSGMGKTAILTQMFKKGGVPSNGLRGEFLFCSWEMESSYVVDRHISHETGLNSRMLSQGAKLIPKEFEPKIAAAYREASALPVRYQQMSLDIDRIEVMYSRFVDECRKKEEVEGVEILPILVIDYIGLAKFEAAGIRTYGIMDFIARIKHMCNKHMGAAFILAQIGRVADERDLPRRADLSDSKSIEDTSDNLILLHRPEYNNVETIEDPYTGETVDSKGKAFIRVWKSRDFGTGDSLINCDISRYRFWSMNHDWGYNYTELYTSEEFWRRFLLEGKK